MEKGNTKQEILDAARGLFSTQGYEITEAGGGSMEIRQLDMETYAGKKFTARYKTNGYYDICASGNGFQIKYVAFETTVEKSFDDAFFGEWLEVRIEMGKKLK